MAEITNNAQPTIVLLHGWGLNSGVWQQVAPLLRAHCQLITPDLPGFGHSSDYPLDYQLVDVVSQLAESIPDNSLVCGWSLGGLLAIALAKYYPQKVAKLALCAASPCFLAKADWPGMQAHILQQFSEALSDNITQTIQRFLAIQAMGSEHARADIQLLRHAIAAYPIPDSAAVTGALRLLAQEDLRTMLSLLPQPVSGCFGRLDSLVPIAVLPALQQLCPKAEFTMFDKASHAPFISHPESFIAWLRAWANLVE